jgi:four helix bundle protein
MSEAKGDSWKKLLVWQNAHEGALLVYRLIRSFPPEERYRIVDQLARASVSVPTNIVEGKGRDSANEFRQFLIVARGSTEETRYLLLLSKDLGLIPENEHEKLEGLYTEVSKMLNALIGSLRKPSY